MKIYEHHVPLCLSTYLYLRRYAEYIYGSDAADEYMVCYLYDTEKYSLTKNKKSCIVCQNGEKCTGEVIIPMGQCTEVSKLTEYEHIPFRIDALPQTVYFDTDRLNLREQVAIRRTSVAFDPDRVKRIDDTRGMWDIYKNPDVKKTGVTVSVQRNDYLGKSDYEAIIRGDSARLCELSEAIDRIYEQLENYNMTFGCLCTPSGFDSSTELCERVFMQKDKLSHMIITANAER